jgi:hypothetical protein
LRGYAWLLDYLIGADEEGLRHRAAERYWRHTTSWRGITWVFRFCLSPAASIARCAPRRLSPGSRRKRDALRVAAENIPGVRRVEEHIVPAPVVPAF